MDYIDISPVISEKTSIFPGDLSFSRQVSMDFNKGDNLILSAIKTTVHIGAHVDAPCHYHPQGESIESRSLNYYLGDCQVIEINLPPGQRITVKDFSHIKINASRVLFKTSSFRDPNKWNSDFNSISSESINYLNKNKVILVGIDTPSIDPFDDKILESHHAVYENNMAILEGVVLDQVREGVYTLIALPLKIKDCDASPVRAVLLKGGLNLG